MTIERLLRRRLMLVAGILVSAALMAPPAHAAKPKIGKTLLVVKQVEGTSEELKRTLGLKDDVFQDEVVETGLHSASDMGFVDDSRLTVGPSSKVVLDKFVYDPDQGTGAFALSMTEGVFRFFSGDMDSSNYSIAAPSVTVGVRGTIIICAINPVDNAFALILESRGTEAFLVTAGGKTAVLDRPGRAAVVHADGSVSVGAPPAWLLIMVEGMDRVISQANITVPPPESQTAAALPPPPPPPVRPVPLTPLLPPAVTPTEEKQRGLPRATANHDRDSRPSGLDRAAGDGSGGQADEHATDPDGEPGGGNNDRDGGNWRSRGGRGNAGENGKGNGKDRREANTLFGPSGAVEAVRQAPRTMSSPR